MANSVEFGPGIRLAAPSKSRNSSRVIHLRRRTTSSSIIAICAAGPPNAVVPSLRKSSASEERDVGRFLLSDMLLSLRFSASSALRSQFNAEDAEIRRGTQRILEQVLNAKQNVDISPQRQHAGVAYDGKLHASFDHELWTRCILQSRRKI